MKQIPDFAFVPADILLPNTGDLRRWSVIACDQFTSDPRYWERVEAYVGEAPSALRLMLPEARLKTHDETAEAAKINAQMAAYLRDKVFRTLPHSYVYLERRITGGLIRRGLLGAIDLECYDYRADTLPLVSPTEGVVQNRLPSRVKIRAAAALEMPHSMVFIDDPAQTVIEPLRAHLQDCDKLYDFELMEDGGHLSGWAISGAQGEQVHAALQNLAAQQGGGPLCAVGDGNHSLAAAKLCWEQLRERLTPAERQTHPARWCLAELVNLHDPAILFEPIHRAVFDTDTTTLIPTLQAHIDALQCPGDAHKLTLVRGETELCFSVTGLTLGQLIAEIDRFIEGWTAAHGGHIDYVHGDRETAALGRKAGCFSLLLPPMDKCELFPGLRKSGPFPKKSFSVGHARDKRYYLECRKILPDAGSI